MKRLYSFTTEDPWEAAFIAAAVALVAGQNGKHEESPIVAEMALNTIATQTIPLLLSKVPSDRIQEMTRQFAALTTAAMTDIKDAAADARPDA